MVHARSWLVALILLIISLVLLAWRYRYAWRRALPRRSKCIWRLHPSTPDDCPHCRLAAIPREGLPASTVRPWREERRSRGAPRRVSTDGYACRKPGCAYIGITDSQVHALVADGHQGRTDHIQQFRCQACGAKVSARWGTALSQLKTPPSRIGLSRVGGQATARVVGWISAAGSGRSGQGSGERTIRWGSGS